jgi:hypothetical protein
MTVTVGAFKMGLLIGSTHGFAQNEVLHAGILEPGAGSAFPPGVAET